jgi:hypothetical protein
MLPGLRFLFAAIILSMSILVFGLGAAALLRAAHEEFASNPSWHATPETMFTQQGEAARPVLAMLRIDMPAADQQTPDNAPVAAAPAEPVAATPAERIAALKPEESPPPAAMKPEIPVEVAPAQSDAAPAADAPASADETKIGPVLSSANETTPAAPEPASAPVSPDSDIASTRIATLGGPAVTIEPPVTSDKPERSVVKKRKHAKRAVQRRRIASRAGVAGQTLQQPADLFAQPTGR